MGMKNSSRKMILEHFENSDYDGRIELDFSDEQRISDLLYLRMHGYVELFDFRIFGVHEEKKGHSLPYFVEFKFTKKAIKYADNYYEKHGHYFCG